MAAVVYPPRRAQNPGSILVCLFLLAVHLTTAKVPVPDAAEVTDDDAESHPLVEERGDVFYLEDANSKEMPAMAPILTPCGQISQLQSQVLRVMDGHYEYGRGIHKLHTLAMSLQRDMTSTRDEINDLTERYTPVLELLSEPIEGSKGNADMTAHNNTSVIQALLTFMRPYLSHVHAQGRHTFSDYIHNVSTLISKVQSRSSHLQRRLSGLRKHMKILSQQLNELQTEAKSNKKPDPQIQSLAKHAETYGLLTTRVAKLEHQLQGVEFMQRDAPAAPRKTQDNCPRGFVHHLTSCYRFENRSANWVQAERACQALDQDAHLVSIETGREMDFILDYRRYNEALWSSPYMWTGGSDLNKEGVWVWVGTGRPFSYTHWQHNQPSNELTNDQHCVYTSHHGEGRWDDWNCYSASLNYICEIRLVP